MINLLRCHFSTRSSSIKSSVYGDLIDELPVEKWQINGIKLTGD